MEIIEGKEGVAAKRSPAREGNKYFSFSSLRGRLAFFKDGFSKKRTGKKSVFQDLKRINLVLQCVIGIAIVALVVVMSIEIKDLNTAKLVVKDAQARVINEPVEVVSLLKQEQYYLKKAEIRDLFQMGYQKRKAVDFKEENVNQTSQLVELTKNLKLVGISWSDDPDAIIENPELDKTYFIRKGYMIDAMKVHEIKKDRVILHYKGEEVEVR